ncbi:MULTISPECIES: hypothetical protein [unclassified Sphingobacterium]|uniref:hypothetical protein n=1 Tax=unclassified Sphingobacterium TaxID=2609468 RepID=UPI0025E006EC|nr:MULTISPECIES: hypothetical protein [unclassified Sphingobacterium]
MKSYIQFFENGNLGAFSHVKRKSTRYGLVPHKPILLSTLVELIEKGIVINNRIEVISLPEIPLC